MLITKVNCPSNKIAIKCPYTMNPEYITVHNTANDASAMSEISYMLGNDYETSFHFAVDDYRAVQGLELNRNGWHAGDGNGTGNRKSIGIEICYSRSGGERFIKAEQNGAELVALLLKQYGWGIDRVKKHQDWSGKYCPHRTLDMGWNRFLEMIKAHLGEPEPVKPSTGLKYKEGDRVTINGVYTSSTSTTKLTPAVSTGTITKVLENARNPYLLENGNIGWTNDNCIVGGNAPQPTPTPKPTSNTFEKGDIVVLNGYLYADSKGNGQGKCMTNYRGSITLIADGSKPYHIDSLGWVAANDIVKSEETKEAVYKTVSNCSWLNLRSNADYGNNVVTSVQAGTVVEYLGIVNGWAEIIYKGRTLYCGSSYLK